MNYFDYQASKAGMPSKGQPDVVEWCEPGTFVRETAEADRTRFLQAFADACLAQDLMRNI